MAVAVRKSNGVPVTSRSSPVGIRFASTGVNLLAAIWTSVPRTSPLPSPARLK